MKVIQELQISSSHFHEVKNLEYYYTLYIYLQNKFHSFIVMSIDLYLNSRALVLGHRRPWLPGQS
jgi:hypothetical protein